MSYTTSFQQSLQAPAAFWAAQAQKIKWFSPPEAILYKDENKLYRWFKGGQMNTAYLALDYHVDNGRADQPALIYDSPVTDTIQKFTYRELRDEVARFAGVLRAKGVQKGDTVIIYMPMIPQTAIAMLACARLGAIHSVVFGGFASHELAIRIDDAKPKLLLTASGGMEINKVIDYMHIVNKALEEASHPVKTCIVYQRDFIEAPLQKDRDWDWERLLTSAEPADCVPLDPGAPLYILYTSGTTGKPKGIMRENGGHAVALKYSMETIYDVQAGDVYWAASDVGWVVGHSYIVYAPLIQGCTSILYEGKPIKTPDAGAFWRVIEQHQVKVLFTAPTAFRAIRKVDSQGSFLQKYKLDSLKYLFLAGERCDISTLSWLEALLNIPVIDHWWQTESGWPMLANMAGYELMPVKPGSVGKPVCGYDIQILSPNGEALGPNQEGAVAIKLPLPPGCLPNLWQNTPRFIQSYLSTFPGYYFSGDGGYRDEDGYFFITGRMDDIINVAGHRLSTAEMEEVVAAHPAIAECAVIGVKDALKGEIPVGFAVLKADARSSAEEIEAEIIQMVRDTVGPVASFKKLIITDRLPKTRSGKILRNVMRHIANREDYATPSTIEDHSVLPELTATIEQKLNPTE